MYLCTKINILAMRTCYRLELSSVTQAVREAINALAEVTRRWMRINEVRNI